MYYICFWVDDEVQFDDPDFESGVNIPSLRHAQENFINNSPSKERCKEFGRKPNEMNEGV
ncbi:CPCC family cysteine-rich protein [Bacillus salitolerans]|uniref:CPCC family cysteine-rich protein n=1 Tax=Bacillus salitolerans TaxID=1437434 RepID=A0ABW4LVL8_9BACI